MSLETILNKKPKLASCSNSYTVTVTFQEMSNIYDNKKKYNLNDPPFQVSLDSDRVNEMVEAYSKNPEYFLSKMIITIAVVTIGSITEYYLMDGQHRICMIKIIHTRTHENNIMLLTIHHVKNDDEMRNLFEDLNKDSSKNLPYVSLPFFSKLLIEELKIKLLQKYKGTYAERKSTKNCIYTVNEFIEILQDNDYFEDAKPIEEIIKNIDKSHKLFFNSLKYLEDGKNDKIYIKKEIELIINHRTVVFFKNNNFIEYLINKVKPVHEYITQRLSISDTLKAKVWKNEFGKDENGACPILYCDSKLSNKTKYGFQCGHVISVANKGKTDEDNLKPICANCNSKMSSQNWTDYEEDLRRENEWDAKFGSDEEGNCDDCNKSIKMDSFYLVQIKKKKSVKYKLVCRKCWKNN